MSTTCPWCNNHRAMIPVPGDTGKMYDRCPSCNNFVPKHVAAVAAMTAQEYINLYGEKFRLLIVDAMEFLREREESWGLDEPIDRNQFIEDLVARAYYDDATG